MKILYRYERITIMRRKVIPLFIIMIILSLTTAISSASTTNFITDSNNLTHEITTAKEFHSAVEVANRDGVVTRTEAIRIEEETSPTVMSNYVNGITQKAIEAVKGMEVVLKDNGSGSYTDTQTIQLDEISTVTVEFSDCEDANVLASIKDFFFAPVYAISQSGSSSLWKGYGDRCFTASMRTTWVLGSAWCKLENHYNLSSGGIVERFGRSYADGEGLARATNGACRITDKYATTPGASDVNMEADYQITYGAEPSGIPIIWSYSYLMKTTVKYVDIDTSEKEIHVTQSWTFNNAN